jgi:hypothetical protein
MVKLFTNPRGETIAVNPELVIMVTEETNGSIIEFASGKQLVAEPFLEVVAKLNEKK